MAIAFVQSANTGSSASTFSKAFASNNTLGNTLFAIARYGNQSISGVKAPTVSDTQGNTGWFLLAQNYSSNSREALVVFCLKSCKAGANTVTIAPPGGSNFIEMVILEYSGLTFSTKPCQVSLGPQGNNLVTTFNAGSVTPNLASNLVLGIVINSSANNVVYTPGGGFTQRDSAFGNCTVFDLIQSSATSASFSGTINTSCRAYAVVLTVDGIDPNNQVVPCDGDSITYGTGITDPWTQSLSLNLTVPTADVYNFGVASETLLTMIANAPTVIDPCLISGHKNICVIWGGTNDMAQSGRTPAQTYASLKTYCAARRAAGWKVVVVTMISRTGNNPVGGESLDTDKTAYNALIRSDPTIYDALADVAGNANLGADGAFSNTTYFQVDGVHPTQLSATTIIAPIIGAAISSIPNPPTGSGGFAGGYGFNFRF